MELKSFRVKNFRSVDDSGLIETDGVTALIGINESGKSNLLLPLWKLNPAKDGELKPTADFPRKSYNDFRSMEKKPIFIEATFKPDEDLAQELATLCHSLPEDFEEILIKRNLSKSVYVSFPKAPTTRAIKRDRVEAVLSSAATEINAITPIKLEDEAATKIKSTVSKAAAELPPKEDVGLPEIKALMAQLPAIEGTAKTSSIGPRYAQLKSDIEAFNTELAAALPNEVSEARTLAYEAMPAFVYYTNYGNLDSEIYLPHVIDNMARGDLGAKEQAKVRTLKVLFEFVGLKPEEILELGLDFKAPVGKDRQPTSDEIAAIAEKKKERSILL